MAMLDLPVGSVFLDQKNVKLDQYGNVGSSQTMGPGIGGAGWDLIFPIYAQSPVGL